MHVKNTRGIIEFDEGKQLRDCAYDAPKKAVSALRKASPDETDITFTSVIRRETYEKLRRKKHSRAAGSGDTSEIEDELKTEYKRIVRMSFKSRAKKLPQRRK